MAIDIDTTRLHRRPLDLTALVEAVVKSGSADEAFWIECKNNGFDLAAAEGRFNAARVIISFANRMPDFASTACGGLAYLIIGAEPGQVDGTTIHDGADLDNWLIKYLGADGPDWSPTYVKHGDKDVLVIVVEAPKPGDPIHTLRHTFNKAIEGTVYYRSGSTSRPANHEEHRLLQDRLVRGHQSPEISGLEVGCRFGAQPNALLVLDPTDEQIDTWIETRREAIHTWHQAEIDAIPSPTGTTLAAAMFRRPSIDADAIEHHLELCRQQLFDATRRVMTEHKFGLLQMTVHNPGRRTLDHVELTLTPAFAFSAFTEGRPDLDPLPEPPDAPKQKDANLLAGYLSSSLTSPRSFDFGDRLRLPSLAVEMPVLGIDIEGDSITLDVYQIRPEKTATSSSFYLFVHEWPDNATTVPLAWTLTSTTTDGVQRGTVDIPIWDKRGVFLPPTEGLPEKANRA